MITTTVDKIVTIKTLRKTLEGIRTAKIIEGKKNEIPRKALEGILTAKIIEGKTNKVPHKTLEGNTYSKNIKHIQHI